MAVAVATALFFCFISQANAWSSTGHQVVAEIARRRLSDVQNAAVKTIMAPLIQLTAPGVTDFVSAAHWMDDIKADTHIFDAWHYIDADVRTDEPVFANDTNVVTILEGLSHKSAHKSAFMPAFRMYTLIHLIGDIHQPFHCGQRDDRGGNDFPISGMGHIRNLHAMWDNGVGFLTDTISITELADAVISETGKEEEEPLSIREWAKESWSISKATYAELEPNTRPSSEYIAKSQIIVKKQLAKAGYRLALATVATVTTLSATLF